MTNIKKSNSLQAQLTQTSRKKLKASSSTPVNMWPLSLQWSVHHNISKTARAKITAAQSAARMLPDHGRTTHLSMLSILPTNWPTPSVSKKSTPAVPNAATTAILPLPS